MKRRTEVGEYHRCGFEPAFKPSRSPTLRTCRPLFGLASSSFCTQASYPMPFMITYCADATVRASSAVGSYSCGSASGLVMMLDTTASGPASWRVMLPQKFSATATRIRPPPALPGLDTEHAPSATAAVNASARPSACVLRMILIRPTDGRRIARVKNGNHNQEWPTLVG